MRLILKRDEPPCLTALKLTPGAQYTNLQGACKEIVVNELRYEQINLCAYCQKILQTVFIEHYIAQSTGTMQLDYSNFLGVCSGKYYLDKKLGTKIDFCSNSRGNKLLTIDPTNMSHINTIYYDTSNKIISSNSTLNNELNNILNLNFIEICEDRQEAFDNAFKAVVDLGEQMELTKLEILQKLKRSVRDDATEFISYVEYRIDKLIEHFNSFQNKKPSHH